ncbi:MAG: hypothetical protein P8Y70_00980 [Candidatus Lokiarchaeota archaeon]
MFDYDDSWSIKIDWLNVLSILGLDSIEQIPEDKRQKAIKKVSKSFDADILSDLTPEELEELVANELRDILKREILAIKREKERMRRDIQNRIVPLGNGAKFKINIDDLKNLEGMNNDFIKKLLKMFKGSDDDDDDDDDDNDSRIHEDRTGYYI